MVDFWEQSPLWQRAEELHAEFKKARGVREEAGEWVLSCVAADADSPHGDWWRERRQAFKDAHEAWEDAYVAWREASEAFDASPVGRAQARWMRDPLNRPAEAFAPAPEEAAA